MFWVYVSGSDVVAQQAISEKEALLQKLKAGGQPGQVNFRVEWRHVRQPKVPQRRTCKVGKIGMSSCNMAEKMPRTQTIGKISRVFFDELLSLAIEKGSVVLVKGLAVGTSNPKEIPGPREGDLVVSWMSNPRQEDLHVAETELKSLHTQLAEAWNRDDLPNSG